MNDSVKPDRLVDAVRAAIANGAEGEFSKSYPDHAYPVDTCRC